MIEGIEASIKNPTTSLNRKDVIVPRENPSSLENPTKLKSNDTKQELKDLVESLQRADVPTYTSSFTKPISESLKRCGIKVEHVDPTPIGEGANHLVYRYNVPGENNKVIKVGKPKSTTTLTHDVNEERSNTDTAKKYFMDYAVNTSIFSDQMNPSFYCVVQDEVKGKPVDNKTFKESAKVRKQLSDIVQINNKLYKEEKMSLDFVGMPGFMSWLKKQFGKLLMRKSIFEVSNILIDQNGDLKIIDFEYFKYRGDGGLKKKAKNFIGLFVNRLLMGHYFGLDIKRK